MSRTGTVTSILVVGGGTAGWMAAAYLNRLLRPTGCRVSLVESAKVGTIGVGEATVPPLVQFVRTMQFDEADLMRHCHATYKLGIRFNNWVEEDHDYWHPFGLCGGIIDGLDLFHFWLKTVRAGRSEGPYSFYSLQALLGETGKAPRPLEGPSTIIETGAYAYHLDAGAFADFLRLVATTEGVTHYFDDVGKVALDRNGSIDHIETESGRNLTADLFLDCTGFQGLLIEQALGDSWIDWSHLLLCDRAVVLPLPPDADMHPYTRSTALSAGWMWQIPLSHRVGCGYVYSSAHIEQDDAAGELLAHGRLRHPRAADPRFLKMRVGRRQRFWVRNCVSVGLASGFVEPLESTGIFLIQKALELLVSYFPDHAFSEALIGRYNERMTTAYEEVRDFIILHYVLAGRGKAGFWRDSREVSVPSSLEGILELYRECGILEVRGASLFRQPSWYHILTGGGCLPRRLQPAVEAADLDKVRDVLHRIRAQSLAWAQTLPSHRALMEHLHRPRM